MTHSKCLLMSSSRHASCHSPPPITLHLRIRHIRNRRRLQLTDSTVCGAPRQRLQVVAGRRREDGERSEEGERKVRGSSSWERKEAREERLALLAWLGSSLEPCLDAPRHVECLLSCLSICRPLFNQYIDTHFICPRCTHPFPLNPPLCSRQASAPAKPAKC